MVETRVTMARANPGLRNASWNKPREGVQDIQEIAGAKEWVEPLRTRDDFEGDQRVVEKVEPLQVSQQNLPPYEYQKPEITQVGVKVISGQLVRDGDSEVHVAVKRNTAGWGEAGARCLLCQRSESECAILVELHSGHICDQCTEEAVDAVRAEIPKRRLRLAMERMLAGDVTPELVEMIEKLSGGK